MKFRFDEAASIDNLAYCLYMEHEENKDRESKVDKNSLFGASIADREDEEDDEQNESQKSPRVF